MVPGSEEAGSALAVATAAAAETQTPPDPKDAGFAYIEFVGDAYKGNDQSTGEFLNCVEGDVVRVSSKKRDQLKKDFPREWKASNRGAFESAVESRSKRTQMASEKLKREEERRAKQDKVDSAMAAGRSGEDGDDD